LKLTTVCLNIKAFKAGLSPCAEIVSRAISLMPRCNVSDNITVIAIFLNSGIVSVEKECGDLCKAAVPIQFTYTNIRSDCSSSKSSSYEVRNLVESKKSDETTGQVQQQHIFRV
jgi:hypothetical protein